jgi:Uma2 family endonuclease
LHLPFDDGIVVGMGILADYFSTPETNHPQELRWGTVVREPAAPSFRHQRIVLNLAQRLERHVSRRGLGVVVTSPIDVVLDVRRCLVLQPDIAFVSAERRGICQERIVGAPDLVIEVLSDSSRRHDRDVKSGWYREYGVRECWLIDPVSRDVTLDTRTFEGRDRIRSAVLPALRLAADTVFEDRGRGRQRLTTRNG